MSSLVWLPSGLAKPSAGCNTGGRTLPFIQDQESIFSSVIPDMLYRESLVNEALRAHQPSHNVEHTKPGLGQTLRSLLTP